ncbi:SpoIID/LytB domain-containing protein [candidate division KSB1 bacterium]|nr:SpoIID/LytB domain-containing protein [candidate division KSB1 bacterium]
MTTVLRKVVRSLASLLVALAILQLTSCLQPLPPAKTMFQAQPEVRVGLILGRSVIHLQTPEPFSVHDAAGTVLAQNERGMNWTLRLAPAERGASRRALELTNEETKKKIILPSGFEIHTDRIGVKESTAAQGQSTLPSYAGRMRFLLKSDTAIAVINILPVEKYLSGVVPAEMSPSFPFDALKAQAIASRSEVLYKLAKPLPNQGYDICADMGCQVYAGLGRKSKVVDRAIRETQGLVLKVGEEVVTAPYSSSCGGHTENNESVWAGNARSHLRGVFDGKGSPEFASQLANEEAVRKWLASVPPAYCYIGADVTARSLEYARGYFRWQVERTADDLAAHLKKKTGENFGELLDLLPLKRGASGRVTRLRVAGSKKSFEITGELAIRQALAPQSLPSAMFVIDKSVSLTNSGATKFTFRGGGRGHGVGMCQVGAAVMALRGKAYDAIVRHYYTDARLTRVY